MIYIEGARSSRKTYYRQRRTCPWTSGKVDNIRRENNNVETPITTNNLELGIQQLGDSTTESPDLSDRTVDVCVEDRPRREAARRAAREWRALINNQSL